MIRLVLVYGVLGFFAQSVQGTDCPGGLVRCPNFMTCCELANKEYGCCPFPNAMCCKDHVHCCPENMQCDVAQQTCRKNGSPLQFYWRVPIQPELIESKVESPEETIPEESNLLRDVRGDSCPDGHPCPNIYTCCKMYKGGYGCCPFENAQCCSDGFHCCPVGSQCNATTGGCDHKTHKFTLDPYPLPVRKATEKPKEVQPLQNPGGKCPDGHPCPEKFTCCKVPDQGYGCCPYSEAVCCTDFIHCCPKGTNCNTTLGTCDVEKRQSLSVPAFSLLTKKLAHVPHIPTKEKVHKTVSNVSSVVCPDERYLCPDGNTCCQLQSGAYGCCPMDHATCCSDHMNCCPHGYRCVAGGCEMNPEQDIPPLLQKVSPVKKTMKNEPLPSDENLQIVICPDKLSVCPDENTCCEIGGGFYGCCPMPKATCCSDKAHCCPYGYRCSSGGCEKASEDNLQLVHLRFTNISETIGEVKSYKEPENDVICPDKYHCPTGNTCCSVGGGEYGCCPMPEATCCSDQEYCCPHGYICKGEGCEKKPGSPFTLPAFASRLSVTKKNEEDPQSYKEPEIIDTVRDVVCPDKYRCPTGNTCCSVGGGEYGCCPMPEATCCSDQEHCCPHGYTCKDGGCERKPGSPFTLPAFASRLSVTKKNEEDPQSHKKIFDTVRDVVCPDKEYRCPTGNTCCSIGGGEYGCCPMPEATCCSDQEHCCPHGYTCKDGGCERKPGSLVTLPAFASWLSVKKGNLGYEKDYPQVMLLP